MINPIVHPFLFSENCVYWKVADHILDGVTKNDFEIENKDLGTLVHATNQVYLFLQIEKRTETDKTDIKVFLKDAEIPTKMNEKLDDKWRSKRFDLLCRLPKDAFLKSRHCELKLQTTNVKLMILAVHICRIKTEIELDAYVCRNMSQNMFRCMDHCRSLYPLEVMRGNKPAQPLTMNPVQPVHSIQMKPSIPSIPSIPLLKDEYITTCCSHKETFGLTALLKTFQESLMTVCPLCARVFESIDLYRTDVIKPATFSRMLPLFPMPTKELTKESPEKPVEKPAEPAKKKKRKITNINFFDVLDKYTECNATWAPAFKEFIEKNSYNNNTIRNFVQFAKVKNLCQKDPKKNPVHPPPVHPPTVQPPVQPTVETTPPRGQTQPVLSPPSLVIPQPQQTRPPTAVKPEIEQYVEEAPDETVEVTELPEIRNIFDEEGQDAEETRASKTVKTGKSPKRKRKRGHSDHNSDHSSDSYSSEYSSSDDSSSKHKRKHRHKKKSDSDSDSDSDKKSDSDKSSSEDSYEEYKRAKRKRHAKRKRKERHAKRAKREKKKKKEETDSESDNVGEGKDASDDEEASDDGSDAKDESPKRMQTDFECRSALELL